MTKRLSSKLLAVILTLAICTTTVLGCLIAASAAESCYTFSAAEFPSEDDLSQATMDVTFTAPSNMPNGFVSGAFTLTEVDADSEDYLTIKGVEPLTNGVNLVNEGNYYIFDGESEGYTTVTFEITFGFSKGEASDGTTYKVKLTDVELAYNDSEYYAQTSDGAIGEITTSCKHVVTVVGEPIATGEDEGAPYGYAVYEKSVCTLCGEQFGYQLVPTAEVIENADAAGTIDLLEFGSYLTDMGSTSTWYDTNVADNGETGASWDDPIIIDSAEEFVYIAKTGTNDTAGKYYKVADGIAGFDLSKGDLDLNGTLADNIDKIQAGGKNHAGAAPGFQGHFDGNGITVYGAWTNHNEGSISSYAGLFSCTYGDVTIKNVNVKFASFTAKSAAGGIVGYHAAADATSTLTIENCSVTDSHIETTGTGWGTGVGAIIGFGGSAPSFTDTEDTDGDGNTTETIYQNVPYNVNNCYVNLDENYFTSPAEDGTEASGERVCHGGVVGASGSSAVMVTNSVVIGVKPYSTTESTAFNDVQHTGHANNFKNVYTDQAVSSSIFVGGTVGSTQDLTSVMTQLTNLKGSAAVAAMTALDWGNTWVMDGADTYPRLVKPGETSDTIYWDGASTKTAPTVGGGTKDDPYIISTVAELAYVVGQTAANYTVTDGKYYKIADGIKNIVMQPYAYGNDIMELNSAAETKAYFEANAANMKQWFYYGWEGSTFCGDLDFNGVTIYGLYIKDSTNNAALISNVDAGAALHDVALKNSYLTSASGSYQVGGLVGMTNGGSHAKQAAGAVWFDGCTVANNYMYNSSTSGDRTGVIIGGSGDVLYMDNCLVYGNDVTYGDGVVAGIWSSALNSAKVSDSFVAPDGLTLVNDGNESNPLYYNMVRNSIILGAKPYDLSTTTGSRFNDPKCYVHVYTDANVATDTFTNGATLAVTEEQIKTISASSVLGAAAETAMPNLAWGTDWFTGDAGEYPAQAAYVTVGVSNVSNPDFVIAGTSVVYEDDGSFSLNIHYIPAYEGFAPTMYVGDTNCTKLFILDTPVESTKRTEIGDDTAMMFTLKGISARYIGTNWHPTLVAANGASIDWSRSAELSIADNARAVIAGDYDTADKNVSFAVLQYGDASLAALGVTSVDYTAGTIDLLEFGSYLTDGGSTSAYYDTNVADNGETGASWDDPIIIDSAEELVYLCKGSGNETAGLYYKVADGIAGFNLSTSALDITKDYEANESVIMNSGKNHAGNQPGFQGHFDGNGATVYGAVINSGGYAGLFSCTKGDVTIKNINVRLSRFVGKYASGGIVGLHEATMTYSQAKTATTSSGELVLPVNGSLTIENCSVADCYIESTGTSYGTGAAAILGYESNSWSDANITYASGLVDDSTLTLGYYDVDGNGKNTYYNGEFTINNCFVDLDDAKLVSAYAETNQAVRGGLVAYASTNAGVFKNCIVIGITPYSTYKYTSDNNHQHSALASHFSNIYTTAATGTVTIGGKVGTQDYTGKIFQLTEAQMTGLTAKDNMTALDWNSVWTTTDGYPTFISKDYVAPASGIIATWDGTVAAGFASGSGTKEDPYIISTAAEFAYMVKDKLVDQAATITVDKYFKVADGISAFVMQKPEYASEIMALGSASDTKAYFEENAANMLKWPNYGWEGSSFCGHFDGNGATVYGLYQTSTNNAGLFSSIDAGAVIQNIGVQNSYLTSSATNFQVAAIAPVANSSGYGVKQEGIVWVNGCTVANNYMYNTCTSWERSGVIAGGFSNDIIMIDNCLVYGNDATYGDGVKMALTGVGNNDVETTAKKPAELPSYVENGGFYCNTVRNSIVLDCDVVNTGSDRSYRRNAQNCVSGVYTNGVSGTVTFTNGEWTYEDAQIKAITPDEVKGSAATSIVETLNAAPIGDTVWYVGATGDYPGFKEAGNLSNTLQALYDGITFTPDTYNDTGIDLFSLYATSLNLNSNPYMSFAFEFGGELKGKQDQVTVTFTYTVNGTEYTYTTTPPASVDADGDGVIDEINNVNGWYNKASAGRFFTYRFKDIPVEALANPIQVSANYNGTDYDLGTVSVGGLGYEFEAQNKLTPSDYYATRIEAVKALLFYTQMIHARYGAQ